MAAVDDCMAGLSLDDHPDADDDAAPAAFTYRRTSRHAHPDGGERELPLPDLRLITDSPDDDAHVFLERVSSLNLMNWPVHLRRRERQSRPRYSSPRRRTKI
jgi:hypothetical protein